ncbi:MAG: DUF4295 domain-containing protein [Prevotellaceae bacterium]|jgi:hypothetical protein|nr:DUF4295 domain-containing protein [Prevotellaceae bacterium]
MAKKAVASFGGSGKGSAKNVVKCIRLVRSDRTGAYAFKEDIVPTEQAKDFFA